MSAKGNNKETWEQLIDSGRVGYMALLRNLRNILNANPGNIQKVFDQISDPVAVRKSKQLPFRFLSAYRNLPYDNWNTREAHRALEKAAEISVENLPRIPGRTVIAIDVSGSMGRNLSSKSDIRCCDISMLLGLIADRICEQSIVFTFDDELGVLNTSGSAGRLLECTTEKSMHGGGTDMYLPFEEMIKRGIIADRIIVLSDNECNYEFGSGTRFFGSYYHHSSTVQALVDSYRKTANPNFWVHAVDLQGYGTQQFIGSKTNVIAGWSEKLFEFISLAEQGEDTLIKRIQNYKVFGEE